MSSTTVRVDASDWVTIRGSVDVAVPTGRLSSVVRAAVGAAGEFTIVELDGDGGVLGVRTTLLHRTETFRVTYRSLPGQGSVIDVASKTGNRFGGGPGIERRTRRMRLLLDSIAEQSLSA